MFLSATQHLGAGSAAPRLRGAAELGQSRHGSGHEEGQAGGEDPGDGDDDDDDGDDDDVTQDEERCGDLATGPVLNLGHWWSLAREYGRSLVSSAAAWLWSVFT